MNKFTFTEKGHSYYLNGKSLTGITTVLGVIAKPNLIQWSADETVKYLKEFAPFQKETGIYLVNNEMLEDAKIAHRQKKEKAGQAGTDVHKIIEDIIKEAIGSNNGIISITEHDNPQVQHFLNWALNNKVKFLESELRIYSESLFLGGTVDGLVEIDNKIFLMDIKTSNSGLYAENFWQCGGYEILLKECSKYKKIDGYILLNLKRNGEFLEKRSVSNDEHIKAFLACLEIYRQKEKTTNCLL